MRSLAYHRPASLEEAVELKRRHEGACWLAGGTDLLVKIKDGGARPAAVISLRAVPGLSGVTGGADTIVGALTPVAEVASDASVRTRHPVLARALSLLGTPQVRNQATMGGNLCNCSPCADSAPPLVVLGARLRIHGPGGPREVPAEEFALGPGATSLDGDELLTEVVIPAQPAGARGAFMKKRRTAVDLALASVAVSLCTDPSGRMTRVRAAAGSVAPVPLRLRAAEAVLLGCPPDADVLARAAEAARDEVEPISDLRASADYRRHVTGVLVARAVAAAAAEEVHP